LMQMGEGDVPLPLTSHTLAPVPVFIGGKGLPDNVVFRWDRCFARFCLESACL
jgi:hypothetical protein